MTFIPNVDHNVETSKRNNNSKAKHPKKPRRLVEQRHLRVKPLCHICYDTVLDDPCVVALFSKLGTSIYTGCSSPFKYPVGTSSQWRISHANEEYTLCDIKFGCDSCKDPEAFLVHAECLRVLRRTSTGLEHIWTTAAWRKPWRQAPTVLNLVPGPNITANAVYETATGLGISQICTLPVEILWQIRDFCCEAPFWRYAAALSCAEAELAHNARSVIERVPMNNVESWKRDTRYQPRVLSNSKTEPRLIRLSIDACGISSLERIFELNVPISTQSVRYIIEDAKHFEGVRCEFKAGLLRLCLPHRHEGYRIWDTPYPPPLQSCSWLYTKPHVSCSMRVIDLRHSLGLTMFYSSHRLLTIHNHTTKSPSATKTYSEVAKLFSEDFVTMVYIPILKGHPVTRVRLLYNDAGQYCSDLSMSTDLGLNSSTAVLTLGTPLDLLDVPNPTMLMFSDLMDQLWVNTIGVYSNSSMITRSRFNYDHDCTSPTSRQWVNCMGKLWYRRPVNNGTCPFRHYSSASLENVASVNIFYDKTRFFSKGILICYPDGTQQVLGQCGIGILPEKRIVAPRKMYFKYWKQKRLSACRKLSFLVDFDPIDTTSEKWDGWEERAMVGRLDWWFNFESSMLRFDNSDPDLWQSSSQSSDSDSN